MDGERWALAPSEADFIDLASSVDPVVDRQEADRFLTRHPDELADLMPTRLGNVLRRHERLAGAPYGLEAITAAPFLAQVAPESVRAYYDDQRTALDVAVRMVVVWGLATIIEIALLWQFGAWLILPFTTSLLAMLSYRGAVHAASSYGIALGVLVALGRLHLYEAMGLSAPSSTIEESRRDEVLSLMLAGTYKDLDYR